MATKLFKEPFVGKYDGMSPETLLAPGSVSDGKNMRKVGLAGGWKARKGCALHNTSDMASADPVYSLHRFVHPRDASDYYFLAQCNSKLLLSPQDPPTVAAATAWTDMGVTVGTTPGFSAMVGAFFFYTDGSGKPVMYGGAAPYPLAVLSYDSSATEYVDITRLVTDNSTVTEGLILGASSDVLYVFTNLIAEGITFDLGSTVNSNSVTATVSSWQSGAWSSRSATDGTASGGATLAVDGAMTWTRSSSDEMLMVNNVLGFVYKISFSGALSASVTVKSVTISSDMDPVTNKWNGRFDWVSGCRFYDQSVTEYQEGLGKVSDESTSMYIDLSEATTSDFLYIKTPEPACTFAIGVPIGYSNTADAQVDALEYWDGDSFAAASAVVDTTLDGGADSSIAQTGTFTWDASAITPYMSTLPGDPSPGYWYRISWDASLADDTRIYLVAYAPYPDTLPAYDGCVEFKGRLGVWGDPEFPNRLRFSATDRPDCFSGSDSTYTDSFGGLDKIRCAVNFYNELIVFKESSIYLLEGYNPATYGTLKISDTVGLASPKTAHVVEVGYPSMHSDEPMSIAIWQDVDGVYVLDGRKPRKVSLPVDHYFNPEYATAIAAANINDLQAFIDPINNEYHLISRAESLELVYNYVTDEWYPPWEREVDLLTGLNLKGTDNRYYTYGADFTGFVMKLESGTHDETTGGADTAIDHYVTSRAVAAQQDSSVTFRFVLRRIWAEMKAQTAGEVVPTLFKNLASSGTAKTAMSMINTGYSMTVGKVDLSQESCNNFQIKFSLDTVDQEMEIWSFAYELEVKGLPGL